MCVCNSKTICELMQSFTPTVQCAAPKNKVISLCNYCAITIFRKLNIDIILESEF